ncbi:MAG: 16S rRNA (cytosine(967)-C(5))-methyltransferase RsmB [Cardiobacteriaceae bacterium]|nr:16S rRNA (cytosine(967)-C(5))-methyltransferase RsmB [Cardiobacteriaceae bacterium]
MINARQAALNTIQSVIGDKRSLSQIFDATKMRVHEADRALYHTLVYDTLRNYRALSHIRDQLLSAPLRANARVPAILLNLGLWQLLRMNLGDHGVIHETVALAEKNGSARTKGLINAVLRRAQRERAHWQQALDASLVRNLPDWLAQAHPQATEALAHAASHPPPLTLRLNPTLDRDSWIAGMASASANPLAPQAVTLHKTLNVQQIPGFAEGQVSVQDAAAQQAALLLAPQNGERLLDACAAPGGKTGHLLELAPQAEVVALDHDDARLARVRDNLARLGQQAHIRHADAADIAAWHDGKPFDAILLDAPCSGSGVLRRHPDIAFLREERDLLRLPQTQARLLQALWHILKPGGRLLYTTCSILPAENQQVVKKFLARHADARLLPIAPALASNTGFGHLHLPDANGDGFFYALLGKS